MESHLLLECSFEYVTKFPEALAKKTLKIEIWDKNFFTVLKLAPARSFAYHTFVLASHITRAPLLIAFRSVNSIHTARIPLVTI